MLANQKEYVGYVTEFRKDGNTANNTAHSESISNLVKPNLPDFLQETSDEVQKKVNFFHTRINLKYA